MDADALLSAAGRLNHQGKRSDGRVAPGGAQSHA